MEESEEWNSDLITFSLLVQQEPVDILILPMMVFSPQCKSGKNGNPTQQGWYLRPPGTGPPPPAPAPSCLAGALQPFLEACSCSLFFRTCSVLLRAPKLDLHVLEKLSIILQKLSKIK